MAFDLKRFLDIVKVLGPVVLVSVKGGEKLAPLVPSIVGAIQEAQQIKGATGPEKKEHVLSIVRAGVEVANATGHVTLEPAEVEEAASDGIDAVIETVKIVAGARPKPATEPIE